MWRSLVSCVVCACALQHAIARPEPAPPARKNDNSESNMLPDETIIIRRLPSNFNYPFSLWPVPKYWSPDAERPNSQSLTPLGRFKNLRFGYKR